MARQGRSDPHATLLLDQAMYYGYYNGINNKGYGFIRLEEEIATNDDQKHQHRLCRCTCCC